MTLIGNSKLDKRKQLIQMKQQIFRKIRKYNLDKRNLLILMKQLIFQKILRSQKHNTVKNYYFSNNLTVLGF